MTDSTEADGRRVEEARGGVVRRKRKEVNLKELKSDHGEKASVVEKPFGSDK